MGKKIRFFHEMKNRKLLLITTIDLKQFEPSKINEKIREKINLAIIIKRNLLSKGK